MTNLIFSRRAVQTVLDELTPALSGAQRARLLERLNRAGPARIPTMWEAVFLRGLSNVVLLKHEVPLAGGTAPDFSFDVDGLAVVGDITAVSDVGVKNANPLHLLDAEIARLARKYRLPGCFRHQIRAKSPHRPYAKVELAIPTKSEFARYARTFIEPFFREISEDRAMPRTKAFLEGGHNFWISYIPDQTYGGGGYPVYDQATHLTKNALFTALRQKSDQLRHAPEEAVRLVIACDGDSAILRGGIPGYSSGTYTAKQIAQDFVRQHSSVDLVALVSLRPTHSRPQKLTLSVELVARPPGQRHGRLSDHSLAVLQSILTQAVETVPLPQQTSHNAAARAKRDGVGPDMIGGYEMSGNRLRLSARALQRLLAGELSADEFAEAHGWGAGERMQNPFLRAIRNGEMIQSLKIEDGGDNDDDWVEFVFAWNPASGPFR